MKTPGSTCWRRSSFWNGLWAFLLPGSSMIIPEESAPVSFVFGCPGFVFSCASSVLPFHFPSCQVRLADVSTCRFKQLLYWHADACGMSFPVVACKSAFPSVPRQRSGCNGVHLQGDEATHRSRPGQTTTSTFFHRTDRTLTILINFTHAYPIPSSTIPLPLNSWFEFLILWTS